MLTTRKPPNNKTSVANPRRTARLTIAPMTPAAALLIPPLPDPAADELEESVEVEVAAHAPVVSPQAEHQDALSPIANLFMLLTNVFHGREVADWPTSGYSVNGLYAAEPLVNKNLTEIWSVDGYDDSVTVELVTSSNTMAEA